MASNFVIAKRYSRALLTQAGGSENARNISTEFVKLAEVIRQSAELQNVFKSPAFSADEKFKILQSLAEKLELPDTLQKFLKVVAFANRAELLVDIADLYKEQVLELEASVEALVETASSLSDAQVSEIGALIGKLVGKKVKVIQKTSPELIAGLRVNVLGKTLDATLSSSLDLVHRELLQAEA